MSRKDKQVNAEESPLAALLDELGIKSMAEFSRRLDCSESTVRNWVKNRTSEPKLSLRQFKLLVKLLDEAGVPLEDVPDSFAPLEKDA